MVRIKHRYLLIDILYPDGPSTTSSKRGSSAITTYPSSSSQNQLLQFHGPTSDLLTPSLLAKLLREQVAELFGDWGVGRLGGATAGGVSVKYLSPATSTAIIRCPRASYRLVWAALTYMSAVPGSGSSSGLGSAPGSGSSRPWVFRIARVSGTMRKAEEEAIRRARRAIVRMKQESEDVAWKGWFGAAGGGRKGGVGGAEERDSGEGDDAAFNMDVDSGGEDEDEDDDGDEM